MKILSGLCNQARMLSGGRRRAALGRNEEGGALVELALTVPVMLGLITAIVTFGITFSNQVTLTQAVGSAGQYLSQIRSSTTNPCADTYTALTNAAPGLSASNISLTVTMNGSQNTGNTCSGKQTELIQGGPVTVYATYPCTLSIYGVSFASGCELTAQVTEYEY